MKSPDCAKASSGEKKKIINYVNMQNEQNC